MKHRLSRITTKTGDDGTTGLADGSRVHKTDPRVAAMGDVDELNSVIGLLRTHDVPDNISTLLLDIQHDLFDLGGALALPDSLPPATAQIERIEKAIAEFNDTLPPLKEFVLPGGNAAAATCHVARSVCRRAERTVAGLDRSGRAPAAALVYLNRLSDLMFVLARTLARATGGEILWDRQREI